MFFRHIVFFICMSEVKCAYDKNNKNDNQKHSEKATDME